jgi:3-hydroxyisobutyrate dehydrogenase
VLDIFVEDMGLVVDAAREHGQPVPLAAAAQRLYLTGQQAGLGRHDDAAVIGVLRRELPVQDAATGSAVASGLPACGR